MIKMNLFKIFLKKIAQNFVLPSGFHRIMPFGVLYTEQPLKEKEETLIANDLLISEQVPSSLLSEINVAPVYIAANEVIKEESQVLLADNQMIPNIAVKVKSIKTSKAKPLSTETSVNHEEKVEKVPTRKKSSRTKKGSNQE